MESKIAEKYIKDFPEGVFYRSGVRHAVEIAEQEMKRKAIEVYKKNCSGAYVILTVEIILITI